MKAGIATFNNVQILDMAKTKVETVVESGVHVPLHLGKNAGAFFKNNKKIDHNPEVSTKKTGDYFYLYTMPLTNYYHMLLDGIGCLVRYFELLESNSAIKLLLNQSPRAKGGVVNHPPFVIELLDLLGIDWEYTDEHCIYERVYFGDTLGQTLAGKRIRPDNRQYALLKQCIHRAKQVAQAPQHNSVSVGGIHTPGFPFPGNNHSSHICNGPEVNCTTDIYNGKVLFVNPVEGAKNYNSPWYINNLVAFKDWAHTI